MWRLKAWKTLRFRLAIWNAGAVALTAAVVIIVVHQATRWELTHSLDELLAEDAEEIRLALVDLAFDNPELRDELDRKAIGHRRHEWFVQLIDMRQQPLWSSVNAPRISPDDGSTLQNPETRGVEAGDGGFRVLTKSIENQNPVRWIRVGASVDLLDQELNRIDRIAFFTWLVSLAIAPIVGWWLAGRALLPLREMVNTASNLRPDRLAERLPTRGAADELEQLAQTINALLDRIATDVSAKHDFLADAAHELRTPLSAIRATADIALVSQRSGDEYRELAAQIMDQTESLGVIVNQLLLLTEATLPSSAVNRKPFSLDAVVAKAVEILRVVAEVNGVTLRVDRNEPIEMLGKREQWIQVLNNLIDNAIKHTPDGGRIAIDLRTVQSAKGVAAAQLTVSDTGAGMHPDDVPRIFDRFFRAERSRTRRSDVAGTGLGLSICRAVVEGHGGTIHCDSQLGHGTIFTIEVPIHS